MNDIVLEIDNFTRELADLVNKYSTKIPAMVMNDRVRALSALLAQKTDVQLKLAKAQQQRVEKKENDELRR